MFNIGKIESQVEQALEALDAQSATADDILGKLAAANLQLERCVTLLGNLVELAERADERGEALLGNLVDLAERAAERGEAARAAEVKP